MIWEYDKYKYDTGIYGGFFMVDTEKLKQYFGDMLVYKNQDSASIFKTLSLPGFLRDWVLQRFCDIQTGVLQKKEAIDFIKYFIPKKEQWQAIKDKLITDGETLKLLTKIKTDIDITTGDKSFCLPVLGLNYHNTVIEPRVWDFYRNDLLDAKGRELWGVIEIDYKWQEGKEYGNVRLLSFHPFRPYTVDLEAYKEARKNFCIEEWIDLLLCATDYNPLGFDTQEQKLIMLQRLLPFLENRVNLLELAPKGTGKSYVFGHLSKYGCLISGSLITRASMFYSMSSKTPGFIESNDYVAIDEAQKVRFNNDNEMAAIMQDYMEGGTFNVSGSQGSATAGIIFLGNIEEDNMDTRGNMLLVLPKIFQESALIDRIHGFIQGWQIPRMNEDLKMEGLALNCEYLTTIFHELRDDLSYRVVVDSLIKTPPRADTRHTEAVKRLSCAFLKLLFPNVKDVSDIDIQDFKTYCFFPAFNMRNIMLLQLQHLDKEYKRPDHVMPDFIVGE